MPVESRETDPDTLDPPGPAKVNVVAGELIVAGFIALLNVAVTGVVRQAPSPGVTETTVGGVKGEVGPPVLLSGSPHPTSAAASKNAGIQIMPTFNLRISFSSSPSYKAF